MRRIINAVAATAACNRQVARAAVYDRAVKDNVICSSSRYEDAASNSARIYLAIV